MARAKRWATCWRKVFPKLCTLPNRSVTSAEYREYIEPERWPARTEYAEKVCLEPFSGLDSSGPLQGGGIWKVSAGEGHIWVIPPEGSCKFLIAARHTRGKGSGGCLGVRCLVHFTSW